MKNFKSVRQHINESVNLLTEGKMNELSVDIGDHMDKHIANYKKFGGAEDLMSKAGTAASKIAKQHKLKLQHAHGFVRDYIESKLHEEVELEEGKTPTTPAPKPIELAPMDPDGATAPPKKRPDGKYPPVTDGPNKGKTWSPSTPGPTNPNFKEEFELEEGKLEDYLDKKRLEADLAEPWDKNYKAKKKTKSFSQHVQGKSYGGSRQKDTKDE